MQEEERRPRISLVAAGLALAIFSGLAGFYAGAAGLLPALRQELTGSTVDTALLTEVERVLRQSGYTPGDIGDLTAGAARGLVSASGDRYAAFYTPVDYERYQATLNPSYSGIGVVVRKSDVHGGFVVMSVMEGAPALRAGLRSGDIIIAVDGRDVTRMAQEEATGILRGPEGSTVTLKVLRGTDPTALQFTITRETIKRQSVQARMLEGSVGYIRLATFSERGVAASFSKAVTDLQRQGARRLIVDLRGNGGGLLDECIKITSVFLKPKDAVVVTETRAGKGRPREAVVSDVTWEGPLAVLVDSSSASASEIFAGAVADHGKGVLIGTKTYGKGSVQSFYTLQQGSTLKLTVERWLTPNGHAIDGQGLEPVQAVELDPADPDDEQLDAALRYLATRP